MLIWHRSLQYIPNQKPVKSTHDVAASCSTDYLLFVHTYTYACTCTYTHTYSKVSFVPRHFIGKRMNMCDFPGLFIGKTQKNECDFSSLFYWERNEYWLELDNSTYVHNISRCTKGTDSQFYVNSAQTKFL